MEKEAIFKKGEGPRSLFGKPTGSSAVDCDGRDVLFWERDEME
jgi:hypothetical protein